MKNAPWCADTSGVSWLMISRDTVSRFFCPCIIELNFATFVLSQSCSWFFCVVSRRLTIIWLMLSLSFATSPSAPTVMLRVRSPLVTAVATSLIARICVVSEGAERVGHVVDGLGERRHFALRVDQELLGEVAIRDGCHHARDAAHLGGQVARHEVHVVGQVLPYAGDAGHVGLAA